MFLRPALRPRGRSTRSTPPRATGVRSARAGTTPRPAAHDTRAERPRRLPRARRLPTYSYRLASKVATSPTSARVGARLDNYLVCHTQSCSSCPSYRANRPPTAHGERHRESRCQTCAWARAGTAKSCRARGRCRSSRGRSCSKISRRGSGDQRPPCRRHGLCRSGRRR